MIQALDLWSRGRPEQSNTGQVEAGIDGGSIILRRKENHDRRTHNNRSAAFKAKVAQPTVYREHDASQQQHGNT